MAFYDICGPCCSFSRFFVRCHFKIITEMACWRLSVLVLGIFCFDSAVVHVVLRRSFLAYSVFTTFPFMRTLALCGSPVATDDIR